ncbi:MAG: hypothetical protein QOD86_1755 [Miltoncostaeaceae bacterium]|jgi:hypothetical protein|nr:hypothetical protein [Miltoncostaeaceae bacterium]
MFTSVASKRSTRSVLAWLVGLAALLIVAVAPALATTSAQQVYQFPEAGNTPSPLPQLPGSPSGQTQQPPSFTPQGAPGPTPTVAGSRVPEQGSYPCVPASAAAGGSGSGPAGPGAEECAPAPTGGTAVRNSVTPGPGESVPVGEVASESGPAPAPGGGSGTLPVTGLDLLIVLAAAAVAAGVGTTLRRAAR